MKTPHKHAATIKAWADGAEIQCRNECDRVWKDMAGPNPCWFEDLEYRIKPEPREDVVMTRKISILVEPNDTEPEGLVNVTAGFTRNVRFVFDGETRLLKHVELL
jgi:hypothetical protein